MAPSPWPDYQCTEPKAPDKKSDVYSLRGGDPAKTNEEMKQATEEMEKGGNEIEIGQLKPQVTALDEYGLKALLDEAMTLRFSEDVEGKSVLLQGLFEEVNAKKPSRAVTEVAKQSSSSGKQSKKSKKIDENGNALCSSKVDDGRKGKTRRIKVKNDRNTVMSQNIEGYRGDTDIEAVIQYIESSDDKQSRKNNKHPAITLPVTKQGRIAHKIRPIRDKSTEAIGRKGRKNNDAKLKKCNSLEEVSNSKLEDLTGECSETKCLNNDVLSMPCNYDSKATTSDTKTELFSAAPLVATEPVASIKHSDLKRESRSENESGGESEFHIVRKKQRKKKKIATSHDDQRSSKNAGINSSSLSSRFNESGRTRWAHRNFGYLEETRGRKPAASVPPSDKSGDSSDADSVHSLPVSSSSLTSKNNVGTNESSLTSYADIARSVTTPPRGGSTPTLNKPTTSFSNDLTKTHCLSSEEIPCVTLPMPKNRRPVCPSASLDVSNNDKDYPPLKKLSDEKSNDLFVEFTLQLPPKNSKCKGHQVTVEETLSLKKSLENKCIVESTTLSVSLEDSISKRPPVILMHEKNGQGPSTAANELVFGFEVNQQLLVSGQNDSIPTEKQEVSLSEEDSVENDSYDISHSKIYNHNHYSIVQYVSREWKLTIDEMENDKPGKVVYFKP